MAIEVAHAKGHADAVGGEELARRTDRRRAFLQATRRKRNVGGDRNIEGADMVHDPIVRRIGAFRHDYRSDARIGAWSHAAIADNVHGKIVAASDALDLRLHRAGIGVDKNLRQGHCCLYAAFVSFQRMASRSSSVALARLSLSLMRAQ